MRLTNARDIPRKAKIFRGVALIRFEVQHYDKGVKTDH